MRPCLVLAFVVVVLLWIGLAASFRFGWVSCVGEVWVWVGLVWIEVGSLRLRCCWEMGSVWVCLV